MGDRNFLFPSEDTFLFDFLSLRSPLYPMSSRRPLR